MKKEINYLIVYAVTVVFATIIAISVERKEPKVISVKIAKVFIKKPEVDWSNIDNPKKKEYLEHLYNTSK
jgi:hypothetical protein